MEGFLVGNEFFGASKEGFDEPSNDLASSSHGLSAISIEGEEDRFGDTHGEGMQGFFLFKGPRFGHFQYPLCFDLEQFRIPGNTYR